jgi:hypothetical protein
MSKPLIVDERTHARLKKYAASRGHLLGRLAADLINRALDAEAAKPKAKP